MQERELGKLSVHNALPGDVVSLRSDDPGCNVKLVTGPRHSPKKSSFIDTDSTKKLQSLWLARQFIESRSLYLVICASAQRAMLFHPRGHLLLVEQHFLTVHKE